MAVEGPDMPDRLLGDVTVVDCGEGVAAAAASRILGDLGARVIKVEPPGGERLRRLGPFAGSGEDLECGGLHLALNAGKESVIADLDAEDGRRLLRSLLRGAEILIESHGPAAMESRGLGYDSLSQDAAALVYVSHTPFGRPGPYAEWVSSEIVDYAMGGYLYFCGDPAREPLMVHGHQGEFHAGMHLALGALFALWEARRSGRGQLVEVSTFESMLAAQVWFTTAWEQEGEIRRREGSSLIRCRDGWVHWQPSSAEVLLLIGRPELRDDPRFQTVEGWLAAIPEVRGLVEEWALERSAQEIYESAQALGQLMAPVRTAADLAASGQFSARGWWKGVEHPLKGRIEIPGLPLTFSRSPSGPASGAPLLGSGPARPAAARRPASPPAAESARAQPLRDLRVVEVTNAWAGPLVGRHLADMDAEVVIVERPRGLATRQSRPAGPTSAWPRFFNRGTSFNQLNRNKRSISLDLGRPGARGAFLRLVRWADVVIENNSPRVFPNLGLSYDSLASENPRLILCSLSAFGGIGPEANYRALGSNIEASSGLVAQTGYGPGELYGTGSFQADPVAGTLAAAAILAALWERERSGRGQHIDVSLQEAGALSMVEALMGYRLGNGSMAPRGNRSWRIAPQGVYRSAGDDDWLALGVETDGQWRALCSELGRPELSARYPDAASRLRAHAAIDEAVGAWSRELDHREAARRLQRAGVPAGPVLANWEVCMDPHLAERGYWVEGVHPEIGYERSDGYPWRLSRTPARRRSSAPLFAEHNDEVLTGVLGLGGEEIAELRRSGALADEPTNLHLFRRAP